MQYEVCVTIYVYSMYPIKENYQSGCYLKNIG